MTLRWANAHTYLLQEEPAAIFFLEVSTLSLSNVGNHTDPLHSLSGFSSLSL